MLTHWKRTFARLGGVAIILAALALTIPLVAGTAAAAGNVTVNVELQGSDNNGHVGQILSGGTASYYANGSWHTITTKNSNNPAIAQTQLPPGTYTFAETYNGTRTQKQVTITPTPTAQTVYFHAALVFVELQGSDNNGHVGQILNLKSSTASASYYADGKWWPITTPDPNNTSIVQAEMLPGTYSFAATYNGTRDQKQQTILEPNANNGANADQIVYFHAALVNVELQGSSGQILSGGTASYYADGQWHAITTKNINNPSIVQAEMLPGTYSFAATYNGTRKQKQYTVIEPNPNNGANADQTVYFHFPTSS